MKAPGFRGNLALAAFSLLVSVALIAALTRPERPRDASRAVTEVVREPGDTPAVRDEDNHFAAGSPAAVAERFLRQRMRYHYDAAAALATGSERARCERNVRLFAELTAEVRDQVREEQVTAEAARFDLEQAVVEDVSPEDGGAARKRVRGVLHARGTVRGLAVESRREQILLMELVEGAWRVAEWTPGRADGGITVR